VIKERPRHFAGFFKTEQEAQQVAISIDSNYEVKYGINCIGTDDFIAAIGWR
jgi:hypothetical protein